MKVFLTKNVEKIGLEGQILKVADGFAQNYLFPKKLAVQVTPENEAFYTAKIKHAVHKKEAVATETSMLAETIKSTVITAKIAKDKIHHDGKLYGSISAQDIVNLLAEKRISITKSQVEFDKSIKAKGTYEVTIKLSSRLKPKVTLKVISE